MFLQRAAATLHVLLTRIFTPVPPVREIQTWEKRIGVDDSLPTPRSPLPSGALFNPHPDPIPRMFIHVRPARGQGQDLPPVEKNEKMVDHSLSLVPQQAQTPTAWISTPVRSAGDPDPSPKKQNRGRRLSLLPTPYSPLPSVAFFKPHPHSDP